jgi:hypothetical protein
MTPAILPGQRPVARDIGILYAIRVTTALSLHEDDVDVITYDSRMREPRKRISLTVVTP